MKNLFWVGRRLRRFLLTLPLLATLGATAQNLPLRGHITAHDPSTTIQCKDRFYQFATGTGIRSKSSADKVFWRRGPIVFTNAPAWVTNVVPTWCGQFWAPDILYFNNQYYLYYVASSMGSQVSAIGLATNPTLDPTDSAYQWTDQGPVIASTNGLAYNALDPAMVCDASGKLWMVFGSYWKGIYLFQLDPATGLRISANSTIYRLASKSAIEASYIYRRGGYYYLFVNWGSCCNGVNVTYNIRVGRSASITGPYLDRSGVDMVNGGGTLFMQGTGRYSGPGHMGILSENGQQRFTYHYYDGNAWDGGYDSYGVARFASAALTWTADDWPAFTNAWSAVYDFEADAHDANGQYSGLLMNDASILPDATYGHVLDLNGTNQFVWLPPGMAYAQTFSAVVNWRGGSPWQRIFDFGTDTSKTFMLTPTSSDNVLRCDLNPGSSLQTLQWTKPLPSNVWTHVAVTLDGSRGILYVDGAPVATNTSMTSIPMNVAPQTNALGQSKFSSDPYFNGQYASFRSYGRALSPAEIVAPQPRILLPAEGAAYQPGDSLSFYGTATDFAARPLTAASLAWRVYYSQDGATNLVFGPVSNLNSGTCSIPATSTGGGQYLVTLTATDSSNRQSTATVTVPAAHPPADWSSSYPLRGNALDANGHFNGTLKGGATFVTDATRGSVLSLSGSGQYVSLPPGAGGMQTFMAWVRWGGGAAWQRIFDFGNDTNHYTVLTPSGSTGKLRFNISLNSTSGEQIADAPAMLSSNVWTHVAVVMNGQSAVIYTNGTPVVTNRFANLVPSELKATNNYLGKSQWPADPAFNGYLSGVRLYSRALTAAEIVAPRAAITQPAHGAVYRPGDTISFAGGATDYSESAIADSGLTWTVLYTNGSVGYTVSGPTTGASSGSFSIPASGSAATQGYYRIMLTAADALGRRSTNTVSVYPAAPVVPTNWSSYYAFSSGAQDASNYFNGTLRNGASIVSETGRGNVLNLTPSSSQYVTLPAGASTAQSISGWVKWIGGSSWQRIFDFGNSTTQWLYLTPKGTGSLPQVGFTADSSAYSHYLYGPTNWTTNVWTHLALTLSGHEMLLHLNGKAVAVNNSTDLLLSDIGATNCYLGRSEFSADPYFNGRLSRFYLNTACLPLEKLIAPAATLTQPASGALFLGGAGLTFAGSVTDYSGTTLGTNAFSWSGVLYSNSLPRPVFGPVTNAKNGSYLVPTNLIGTTNLFYRITLTATDTNGYQQTASADVRPYTSSIAFSTLPAGLQLTLDNQPLADSASLVAVAGMSHTVSAPSPQLLNGSNYSFVLWSDGGAASHLLTIPLTNTSLLASYVQPALTLEQNGNQLSVSWPAWAGSLVLSSTTNLTPPVIWTPVTNLPTAANGQLSTPWLLTNAPRFFRLQSP
jgi:arabinan endo-1,5-alpha-L-arabinosidase